jgi:co-chaperonin GroES (HSP10)
MTRPTFKRQMSGKDGRPEPFPGFVLLKPDNEKKQTAGGIIIPEKARTDEYFWRAQVAGVAPSDAENLPFKAGDIVVFDRPGTDFWIDGEEYLIVPMKQVIARIPQLKED